MKIHLATRPPSSRNNKVHCIYHQSITPLQATEQIRNSITTRPAQLPMKTLSTPLENNWESRLSKPTLNSASQGNSKQASISTNLYSFKQCTKIDINPEKCKLLKRWPNWSFSKGIRFLTERSAEYKKFVYYYSQPCILPIQRTAY